MRVALEAPFDLRPHALLHLQELGLAQPELGQSLLDLARLLRQAVSHRRHHGGAFRAATLGQQEADVGVRDQAAHRLVQAAGVPVMESGDTSSSKREALQYLGQIM